jgi:hypothetical protein
MQRSAIFSFFSSEAAKIDAFLYFCFSKCSTDILNLLLGTCKIFIRFAVFSPSAGSSGRTQSLNLEITGCVFYHCATAGTYICPLVLAVAVKLEALA